MLYETNQLATNYCLEGKFSGGKFGGGKFGELTRFKHLANESLAN